MSLIPTMACELRGISEAAGCPPTQGNALNRASRDGTRRSDRASCSDLPDRVLVQIPKIEVQLPFAFLILAVSAVLNFGSKAGVGLLQWVLLKLYWLTRSRNEPSTAAPKT